MDKLVHKLRVAYPNIRFRPGKAFCWSPADNTVCYAARSKDTAIDDWSLLHELGHAVLGHKSYPSDFALIKLESAAWAKAHDLGKTYGIVIDYDHIQDCLDTYRDWLHQRSTCPTCGSSSLQSSATTYECFNCRTNWTVTVSRFCRPYRKLTKTTSAVPQEKPTSATFL